jgi:hypothetical protein
MPRDLWLRRSARALLFVLGAATPAVVLAAPADGGGVAIKDSAEVTFTGYQSLPGARGIVFVELTDAVAVEVTRHGPVIEYRLIGAKVPLKNNRNPLLLRDFDSSALSAVLVVDKPSRDRKKRARPQPSVRLVLTLRGAASPSFRMVSRGKGAALEVELGPAP